MKTIFFPLQKLLVLFFFVELLIDADSQIFLVCSTILLVLGIIFEGARPITPLFTIIILIEFFGFSIIQALLIAFAGLLAFIMQFYDINIPFKGKYMVGHKYVKVEHQNTEMLTAIYYPVFQKGQKVQWIPEKAYNKTLYEIFYVDPITKRLPYQLFKFAVSYIQKIWIPVQGNSKYLDSSENQNKSKVIIFSHGLGAHLNAYTSFCGYWASHGYTVVSINHTRDQVCVDYVKQKLQDIEKIGEYVFSRRHRDLLIRVSQIKKVIDVILKENYLGLNLGQYNKIDQIILAGHSYGGAAVLATKSIITRQLTKEHQTVKLLKKIICLDPWLFPFNNQIFEHLNQEDILIINSHYFMREVPEVYRLEQKFCKLKETNKTMKAAMVQKMSHISQSDMAYIFGNLQQFVGIIKNHRYTDYFIALNIFIMQQFIENKGIEEIIDESNKFVQQKRLDKAGILVRQQYRVSREITISQNPKGHSD